MGLNQWLLVLGRSKFIATIMMLKIQTYLIDIHSYLSAALQRVTGPIPVL